MFFLHPGGFCAGGLSPGAGLPPSYSWPDAASIEAVPHFERLIPGFLLGSFSTGYVLPEETLSESNPSERPDTRDSFILFVNYIISISPAAPATHADFINRELLRQQLGSGST